MKRKFALLLLLPFAVPAAFAADAKPKMPVGKSDAPIEINADTLEVQQDKNVAVFSGHVVAIQDTMRLKSEKMTVYYRSPDEKNKQSQQDAIRKIEVEGNVFMTTPDETASGASGVYDVENNRVTLNNGVVLTRGKNTLKGDTLVYDMNTGKSTISSAGKAAGENGKGKERVRALFVPDEKDKK